MILPDYGLEFWVATIIAVIFVGIAKAGFGGGVGALSTPLMSLVLPVAEAAALLLPLMILADQVAVYKYKQTFDRKTIWITLPGAIVGIGLAWLVFDRLVSQERLMKLGMGLISLLFVVYQLTRDYIFKQIEGVRFPNWVGQLLGTTAGFTSTIAHVGGPPFQIYVIPQKFDRDVYVGTNAWFFWAVNLLKLIPFGFLGFLTIGNLTTTLVLIPIVIVGVYLGVWLNQRVSQGLFNGIIYSLMAVTGAQLVLGRSLLSLFFS